MFSISVLIEKDNIRYCPELSAQRETLAITTEAN
jgi:hypothetical protein